MMMWVDAVDDLVAGETSVVIVHHRLDDSLDSTFKQKIPYEGQTCLVGAEARFRGTGWEGAVSGGRRETRPARS